MDISTWILSVSQSSQSSLSENFLSVDKYVRIFSHQMDAIDYIVQYSDKVDENKTKNRFKKMNVYDTQ